MDHRVLYRMVFETSKISSEEADDLIELFRNINQISYSEAESWFSKYFYLNSTTYVEQSLEQLQLQ